MHLFYVACRLAAVTCAVGVSVTSAQASQKPLLQAHLALHSGSARNLVSMTTADPVEPRIKYRVIGASVQRSLNNGVVWNVVLQPQTHRDKALHCLVSDYNRISGMQTTALAPRELFVTTVGSASLESGPNCRVASGGLFILQPTSAGLLSATHSQAAGLPFAQHGSSGPHSYALISLFVDPVRPNLMFADAALPLHGIKSRLSPPLGLYRSSSGGRFWSFAGLNLPRTALLRVRTTTRGAILYSPTLTSRVYDIIGGRLFTSVNEGMTWSPTSTLPRLTKPSLDINQTNPWKVIASSERGDFHSLDGGQTWLYGHSTMRAPKAPAANVVVSIAPTQFDQVMLVMHGKPLAATTLSVFGIPIMMKVHLTTDSTGFGHAQISLGTGVLPRLLRVKVDANGVHETVTPLLVSGWMPGLPYIPPTATPSATSTAAAVPTAYPPSSLTQKWQWKSLVSTLPACSTAIGPRPTTPPTATTMTSPLSRGTVVGTATIIPIATSTPSPTLVPPGSCNAGAPSARQDESIAWDNATHNLYVFGGSSEGRDVSFNDISSYNTITNTWSTITPSTYSPLPAARYGTSVEWDAALQSFLLFGGMSGSSSNAQFYNDVWSFTPSSRVWTQLSANSATGAPSRRAHTAVAWDGQNGRLLLFGGQSDDAPNPTLINDLWSFTPTSSGGTWVDLSPSSTLSTNPSPRQVASIGWDNGTTRLFGGQNSGGSALSDTWNWTPTSGWVFVNAPNQPPGREAGAYTWDDTHQRFMVGPGLSMDSASNDVWNFDSPTNNWLQIPVSNTAAPPLRYFSSMVWDSTDNQALMFGGRLYDGGVSQGLWALVPTGQTAIIATATPFVKVAKGVNLQQVVSSSGNIVLVTNSDLNQAAALGATFVRVSFYAENGNTTWSLARFHAYEQVVAMIRAHGLDVMGVASSGITGGWAVNSWTQNAQETTGGNGDNSAIDDYVNQLALLLSHFRQAPYSVVKWELWNEPNVALSAQCAPTSQQCLQTPSLLPSNFAALLIHAYQVIKGTGEQDPSTHDIQLISGAVLGHSINGIYSKVNAGNDYIANVFNQGVHHGIWPTGVVPMDQVGDHLYVDQNSRTTPAVIGTYLAWFHAAYAAYAPGLQTAVTEIGWQTGDSAQAWVAPDVQALNLDNSFFAAETAGFVQSLCWYELRDNPVDPTGKFWGLLDKNGSPKLGYVHFHNQ